MNAPLLEVDGLVKHFRTGRHKPWSRDRDVVHAVDGVSFTIDEGQTFALVGESGCGKTTTSRMVLRLLTPTAGRIVFQGRDVTNLSRRELRSYWRGIQAVFQDPYSSLNPRMRVGDIIGEPLLAHGMARRADLDKRVGALLEDVGLDASLARDFAHEFSGGMRQRVAIARALALKPSLVVLDEPMSSLDVSVRAQIINLLTNLQRRHNLSYLLIAHDLATVRHLSDEVAVMYLGEIVEHGSTESVFASTSHPYTQSLITSAGPGRIDDSTFVLAADLPSPRNPPSGCRFHTRCPVAIERCDHAVPCLEPTVNDDARGHVVACHLNIPSTTEAAHAP